MALAVGSVSESKDWSVSAGALALAVGPVVGFLGCMCSQSALLQVKMGHNFAFAIGFLHLLLDIGGGAFVNTS